MNDPASASLARSLYAGALHPDRVVATLQASDRLLPSAVVARAGPVRPLPPGRAAGALTCRSGGRRYDLADYLAVNRVAGLLILKDGAVALEDYELGLTPQQRWASFSLAKSVSSMLVGSALQAGLIADLDEPMTRYLPALAGSAYHGVSIRDVLEMASGVGWDETYSDPGSDRRRFLDRQLEGRPGALLGYMASLARVAPAGARFNYSTGESFLIGALLEAATGRPLARYLSEALWSRLGMEADATWWTESPGGAGIGGSGLAATLRDYARFGQFVLDGGAVDGERLVPAGWVAASTAPRMRGGARVDYGYQWWLLPPGAAAHAGAFAAQGIFGQRIYLNPAARVVIVVLSARSKPTDAAVVDDAAFFAAVVEALA